MLELLQGKLSQQVMSVVTDHDRGLFPNPGEIRLECSCPDWASMCKHMAAVLCGVGRRLDDHPESLFVLRGVDTAELIATEMTLPGDSAADNALADDVLAGIFGIDLDTGRAPPPAPKAQATPRKRAPPVVKARDAPATRVAASPRDICPTGKQVARLRRRSGLSVARFARQLGVSPVTVYRWEAAPGTAQPALSRAERPVGLVPAVRKWRRARVTDRSTRSGFRYPGRPTDPIPV